MKKGKFFTKKQFVVAAMVLALGGAIWLNMQYSASSGGFLNPVSVNSCRILTLRRKDGKTEVLAATLKTPRDRTDPGHRRSGSTTKAYNTLIALGDSVEELKDIKDNVKRAFFCKDTVIPLMDELRTSVDELEMTVSSENWPYPSIGELLFGVR